MKAAQVGIILLGFTPLYGMNSVEKSIKEHKFELFKQNLKGAHKIAISGQCGEWSEKKLPEKIQYIHTPTTNLHDSHKAEILNTDAQLKFLEDYHAQSTVHVKYLQEHKNESRLKIASCIGVLTGGAYLLSRFVDNDAPLWSTRSELYTWCGLALSILLSVRIDIKEKQKRRHIKAIHNVLDMCKTQTEDYLSVLATNEKK